MWTATTSPSVSTLPLHAPLRVLISTISTTLHSSEAGLSATRGAATSRHSAIVSPAQANSLSPRGSGAEVTFIGSRSACVARLATNSPLSRANEAEILPALAGEADDRGHAAKAVEEAVGGEIDPPVERARRNPADRTRGDDRLERIMRQLRPVAFAGLVEHRPPHSGKVVTISDSGGRGRSSTAAALPMWMKPAIFSCSARPIAARKRAS